MTTPDPQPAPLSPRAAVIDVCDRALRMVEAAPYSDVVAEKERFKTLATLYSAQVYRLTADLTAVAININRNTDASLEEALERATSGAHRGAAYLHEADGRPDLRDRPENLILIGEHRRSAPTGGRL